jgi:hypothetical protein
MIAATTLARVDNERRQCGAATVVMIEAAEMLLEARRKEKERKSDKKK